LKIYEKEGLNENPYSAQRRKTKYGLASQIFCDGGKVTPNCGSRES